MTKEQMIDTISILRRLSRWVGKGIADRAYADCAGAGCAESDLKAAESKIVELEVAAWELHCEGE